MSKIEEAQEILNHLELPPAQCNEISALTFLALTNLKEEDSWENTSWPRVGIHDIILFAKDAYGKVYAENTRETIRRHVIHQFEQARVVDRNPDEPTLPTNSPRTHYALTEEVYDLVREYGKKSYPNSVKKFREMQPSLLEIYRKEREAVMVPLKLSSGEELKLSPGKHNELQAEIINEFAPRFAPGASLVYLGDTSKKDLHVDTKLLEELNIPVTQHDKLPDVVLYDKKKNWLYLIEAVTSHGPVTPKRQYELEEMLNDCPAEQIYISAFPDFKEFKNHLTDIAWETEVWLSEIPDHIIHFNGDKFLGPHTQLLS